LVQRIHPVIAASVSRIARQHGLNTTTFLEDLSQEVYVHLCEDGCRVLRGFHSGSPDALFPFLKVVASNIARDRCKSALSLKAGAGKFSVGGSEDIDAVPQRNGPDIERTVLEREIDTILSKIPSECSGRDRTIFWLYYRQGWSSKDIAFLPAFQLTQKGVESLLHRLAKLIRTEFAVREEIKGKASVRSI
jgi:RNA polymerase sigma-70 factor (ECF subfamily)